MSGGRPPVGRAAAVGLAMLALLGGGTLASIPPLECGLCDEPVRGSLGTPPLYLALSPALRTLDALAFLSLHQHFALLSTALVLYALWRVMRRRGRDRRPLPLAAAAETVAAGLFLGALVGLYALAVAFPRPQARIELADPDELAVDFHSHTLHSHDGRELFTAGHNRAWHGALGFDAAYITDHGNLRGVEDARRDAGRAAGGRTVILPGVEVRLEGRSVVLLGVAAGDTVHFPRAHIDLEGLALLRSGRDGPVPVVLALPGSLDEAAWGFVPDAIEAVNAAPRGLEQLARERARLVELRDGLDIPLVTATNNHGWFPGAVAWSVMRIPGWRDMTAAELDLAIRTRLVRDGPGAVRVVERARVADAAGTISLAGTVPLLVWHVARTQTPAERLVWLAWAALILAAPLQRAVRAPRRGAVGPLPEVEGELAGVPVRD